MRILAFTLLASALSGPALAQQVFTPDDELKKKIKDDAEVEEGKGPWSSTLKLGLTFVFTDAQNVVGTDDGTTLTFGLLAKATLDYAKGPHRWTNSFSITENVQRTPQLAQFVKTFDLLDFKSLYIYKLNKPSWLGPFARFTLQTPVFEGEIIRSDPFQVRRVDAAGDELEAADPLQTQTSVGITGAFEPLQLRESVGLFADPYKTEPVNIEIEAGVGAQQIIVRDGLVVADEADGVITLQELESIQEFGGELELSIFGDIVKDVLTYDFSANAYVPAVSNGTQDFSFEDSVNIKIAGLLSVAVADWLAFEYTLNVIRQPRVLEAFQVQNGVNLALTFDLI
ncbi:MAG: hypothetical protein AAF627_06585 [Myxococcota bacterium]